MFKQIKQIKKLVESKRGSENIFWIFSVSAKDFLRDVCVFCQKGILCIYIFKKPSEVFTEIYKKNTWGGKGNKFYSGSGSHDDFIVQPYITMASNYLKNYGQKKPRIVDLGCGDFNVGKNFIDYCSEYIGVDVVPGLIKELEASNYPAKVKFLCLDIVKDNLPDGDICFVRQVLQHLSNGQIIEILSKLKKYKVVFITEHYPLINNQRTAPNKDIINGPFTRVGKKSAVFLDKPPFNIPTNSLQTMLEVILPGPNGSIIRTYKVEF